MLKVMPWPWFSVSKQIWIGSFNCGTLRSCRSTDCKNIKGQIWRSKKICPGRIGLESGWVGNFLSTSNFDLWYFCSLLTYKDVQYLIWKIWFISVWILKAKVMAWLLTWFIFTQNTLISYHTEAFVKTEVGFTVAYSPPKDFLFETVKRIWNILSFFSNSLME